MGKETDKEDKMTLAEWFPELNLIQVKMLKGMLIKMVGEDLDFRGNSPEVAVNEFKAKLRKEIGEL